MLQCLHTPVAPRRSFTLPKTRCTVTPRCGHRIAASARISRRQYKLHAAGASQPEVDSQDKNEGTQTEDGAAETGPQSALERARSLLIADEIDREALAAALNDVGADFDFYRERVAAADEHYQALESTLQSTKDQFVRLTADFENFRRRTKEEKDRLSSSVKGDVVLELLPLVDNFELARTQVKAETEGEQKINNSYQGLYKQMVEILKSLGVEPVDTVGSPFDPEKHEAIMRQPNDDVPDGTVLMEFRKGFAMGERLLRPAMVQVSYTDAPAPASSEGGSKEE